MEILSNSTTDDSEPHAGVVFAWVWFWLTVPVCVTGVVWFYLRRNVQPIKARMPIASIALTVMLLLWTTKVCMLRADIDVFFCGLDLWFDFILTVFINQVYLVRCWTLYYRHQRAQEILFQLTDHAQVRPRHGSRDLRRRPSKLTFIRNKHWMSNVFLLKVAVPSGFVLLLAPILYTCIHPNFLIDTDEASNDWSDECNVKILVVFMLLNCIIFTCCAIFTAYKLWHVHDAFFIKDELRIIAGALLFCIPLWGLFALTFDSWGEKFPVSTIFALLFPLIAFMATIAMPLFKSYSETKRFTALEKQESVCDFEHLLEHPDSLETFRRFLVQEFSIENLLFYEDVQEFKKMDPQDKRSLVRKARRIYERYLSLHSPLQVNLSEGIVGHVFDALLPLLPPDVRHQFDESSQSQFDMDSESERSHQLSSSNLDASRHQYSVDLSVAAKRDAKRILVEEEVAIEMGELEPERTENLRSLFDEAERQVLRLMKEDSFMRFRCSKLWDVLLERNRKREALKQAHLL